MAIMTASLTTLAPDKNRQPVEEHPQPSQLNRIGKWQRNSRQKPADQRDD